MYCRKAVEIEEPRDGVEVTGEFEGIVRKLRRLD